MISFQVYGLPAAQGSKNPYGGESSRRLKPWRQDVAVAARNGMGERSPTSEPVEIEAVFSFPRPKSHFGTGRNARTMKSSAPDWVSKAPDLDKLQRALGDAITGVVVRDDAQIVSWITRKVYDIHPGVRVKVTVAR